MSAAWLGPFGAGLGIGALVALIVFSLLLTAADADRRQEQWAADSARDMSAGLTPLTEQRAQLRLVGSGPYDWAHEDDSA